MSQKYRQDINTPLETSVYHWKTEVARRKAREERQREDSTQIHFGCEEINTSEKRQKWDSITMAADPRGSLNCRWQNKSAPWLTHTYGPCRLYMCFMTGGDDLKPYIVVPVYVQEPCAIAQGITRLKLNCPPGTPPLAVKLLAQACAHFMEMGVQWLFISPISSFREKLLAFFAENKVHHGDLGMDRLSTMSWQRYNEGTTWVKLYHDEDYMDYCTLITLPKLDPRQTSMTWEAKDWPLSIFDLGAMLQTRKRWDVVHQRWLRGGKRTKDPKDEQEEDEIRRLAPYNFLYSLFGDGIIVVDTKSLAKFA